MPTKLDELKDKIRRCDDLRTAVETLIHGVADELNTLDHDPVAIQAMAGSLHVDAGGFAEAICARPHPHKNAVEAHAASEKPIEEPPPALNKPTTQTTPAQTPVTRGEQPPPKEEQVKQEQARQSTTSASPLKGGRPPLGDKSDKAGK